LNLRDWSSDVCSSDLCMNDVGTVSTSGKCDPRKMKIFQKKPHLRLRTKTNGTKLLPAGA